MTIHKNTDVFMMPRACRETSEFANTYAPTPRSIWFNKCSDKKFFFSYLTSLWHRKFNYEATIYWQCQTYQLVFLIVSNLSLREVNYDGHLSPGRFQDVNNFTWNMISRFPWKITICVRSAVFLVLRLFQI